MAPGARPGLPAEARGALPRARGHGPREGGAGAGAAAGEGDAHPAAPMSTRPQCMYCFKSFKNKNSLAAHKSRYHTKKGGCNRDEARRRAQEARDFKVREARKRARLSGPDADAGPEAQSRPERFPCQSCGKDFASKKSLAVHRRRFHRQDSAVAGPSRPAEEELLVPRERERLKSRDFKVLTVARMGRIEKAMTLACVSAVEAFKACLPTHNGAVPALASKGRRLLITVACPDPARVDVCEVKKALELEADALDVVRGGLRVSDRRLLAVVVGEICTEPAAEGVFDKYSQNMRMFQPPHRSTPPRRVGTESPGERAVRVARERGAPPNGADSRFREPVSRPRPRENPDGVVVLEREPGRMVALDGF